MANIPREPIYDPMIREQDVLTERQKHLQWCKDRAIEYLNQPIPDIPQALASFISDMGKHRETGGHIMLMSWPMMMSQPPEQVENWINDFK